MSVPPVGGPGSIATSPLPTPGSQMLQLIDAFLPDDTNQQQQAQWDNFLVTSGYQTVPADDDPTAQAALLSYLRSVSSTPYPTTGPYAAILTSFLGSQRNPADIQSYWLNYLQNMLGVTSNPPDSDIAAQGKLVKFMQAVYTFESQSELPSPQESQKRAILSTTFDTVLTMLNSLQNTVSVQSTNLIYYGNLQQQYTNMMTRLPIYTATGPQGWTADTTDASNFTIGYNNTTIAEVSNYIASQIQAGVDTSFVFTNHITANDTTIPSGNMPFIAVSFNTGNATTPGSISIGLQYPEGTPDQGGAPFVTNFSVGQFQGMTAAQISQAYSSAFLSMYNDTTTTQAFSLTGSGGPTTSYTLQGLINADIAQINAAGGTGTTPFIQTPFQGSTTDTITQRGDFNNRNQSRLQVIKGLRDAVQQTAQQYQNFLSQDQNTLSNQSDLLTSMLQEVSNIMDAIFQPPTGSKTTTGTSVT